MPDQKIPGRARPSRASVPHWRYLRDAYEAVGVTALVDARELPRSMGGCVYNALTAALGCDDDEDVALAAHDLAHLLVAPARRRRMPNFGLGPHPSVTELRAPLPAVTEAVAAAEEHAASCVNVLLAFALFDDADAYRCSTTLGYDDADVARLRRAPAEFMWLRAPACVARIARRGMLLPGGSFALPAPLSSFVAERGTMRGMPYTARQTT